MTLRINEKLIDRLIIILFIFACTKDDVEIIIHEPIPVNMAAYYIAPNGNDGNAGTVGSPWYTLSYAKTRLAPGDILYVRGGTYYYTDQQNLTDFSGTAGNGIIIINYPGEYPVFDGRDNGDFTIIYTENISYISIVGIHLTNLEQPHNPTTGYYGIYMWNDSHDLSFSRIEVDHIGGWGIVWADGCSNNTFTYCDPHHNQDPWSDESADPGNPYGGSDGFESGSHGQYGSSTSTNVWFIGCRSWWNSDDGWDLRQADGEYFWVDCWAFWNGYIPGTFTPGGNGVGFKLGGKQEGTPGTTDIRRTVRNCMAIENRMTGFSPEPDSNNCRVGTLIENCLSYGHDDGNGNSWGIASGGWSNYTVVRNCISYNNYQDFQDNGTTVHDHNNFDIPVTASDADFVSVNTSQLTTARRADGRLPILSLFHLVGGSNLIGIGATTSSTVDGDGVSWNTPRAIGAFENGGSVIPVSAVTVTGAGNATTITVDNGTLQMSAHIDPHDATNQSVVWSVINGTGAASIDQNGLLTAIADGTVTVKAVSNG